MLIKEFILLVSKFAPILGSLLGTPITGSILSLIFSHYGVDQASGLSALAKEIESRSEELRALEDRHQEALLALLEDMIKQTEAKLPTWIVGSMCLLFVTIFLVLIVWSMLNGID